MQLAHVAHELRLGFADVEQRLARLRGRVERDEVDLMPAAQTTPTCDSSLSPPIPGPWPARGSMRMYGRFAGSIAVPAGGTIRSSA
jgi:hypothetical protein